MQSQGQHRVVIRDKGLWIRTIRFQFRSCPSLGQSRRIWAELPHLERGIKTPRPLPTGCTVDNADQWTGSLARAWLLVTLQSSVFLGTEGTTLKNKVGRGPFGVTLKAPAYSKSQNLGMWMSRKNNFIDRICDDIHPETGNQRGPLTIYFMQLYEFRNILLKAVWNETVCVQILTLKETPSKWRTIVLLNWRFINVTEHWADMRQCEGGLALGPLFIPIDRGGLGDSEFAVFPGIYRF